MPIISENKQNDLWSGKFGEEYNDRNTLSDEGFDDLYKKQFGISRNAMNTEFLGDLNRDIKILEVGCNIGQQLRHLQKMGFKYLYGIDIQIDAVEKSKIHTKGINIIQGDVFNIPFKNNYFDLVYTSGVLIHISPEKIKDALEEINRCSKKYIWGMEYYADYYTEVKYRGNNNAMWKTDFAKLYTENFSGLSLVKKIKYKYLAEDNVDIMYLLEK